MDDFDKAVKNEFDEKARQAVERWGSVYLLKAWTIISTPNWEDGEPVLRHDDIEALADVLMKVRDEIKALKGAE